MSEKYLFVYLMSVYFNVSCEKIQCSFILYMSNLITHSIVGIKYLITYKCGTGSQFDVLIKDFDCIHIRAIRYEYV